MNSHRRATLPVLLLAGGLLLPGCVMPDQVKQIQNDLADVRQELRAMQSDQQDALDRMARIESAAAREEDSDDRAQLADLSQSVQELSRDLRQTDEQMGDLDARLDRLTQSVQQNRQLAEMVAAAGLGAGAARQPGGGPAETAVDPTGTAVPVPAGGADSVDALADPGTLYNNAYADFSKGNYALAVSGFEEYQKTYPGTALADNALYWIGECHFSQGGFGEAIQAFDRLLELYPDSDKAAAGNLKKALAYLEQNEIGTAIIQLRYVVSSYPESDEARIARDKLASLGAAI